jgi:predicted DsbA family dithiol-disulfide isomerase
MNMIWNYFDLVCEKCWILNNFFIENSSNYENKFWKEKIAE